MNRLREKTINKVIFWILRSISIILIIYSILGLLLKLKTSEEGHLFVIIQSTIFLILSFIPYMLEKYVNMRIKNSLQILYILLCAGALLVGEVFRLYVTTKWWDKLIHFTSSMTISLCSLSLLNIFFSIDTKKLSPFFIIIFVFSFTSMIGVIWEIIEFITDELIESNMQRYMNSNTEIFFIGHKALSDTMFDLIINSFGALVISIYIFFSANKKKTLPLIIRRSI